MPEIKIYGKFRIMSKLAHTKEIECQRCGYEFEIDTIRGKNMIWIREKEEYIVKCPLCGTYDASF
jgi:uncharacterized Zn finger protein